MGKIVVKAQQQNVYNKDGNGVIAPAYVLRPVRYTTMGSDEIINYCAANSVVPKAYISATMVALAQCIENFLLNGHSVEFPNLGIFSLSTQGCSETDANKAGLDQLNKVVVRFLPCVRLKGEVDDLELEFDGVYDIAGENSRGEKYYSKVVRTLSADDSGSGGSNGGNGETPTPSANVTITANANDATMGGVTGGGTYVQGASVTLTATANEGYHFVSWSNGRTTASITVTADADATYTATFAADSQGGSGDNSGMDG